MIALAGALRLGDGRHAGPIRAVARWPLDTLADPCAA
jgi:hypothetical protein